MSVAKVHAAFQRLSSHIPKLSGKTFLEDRIQQEIELRQLSYVSLVLSEFFFSSPPFGEPLSPIDTLADKELRLLGAPPAWTILMEPETRCVPEDDELLLLIRAKLVFANEAGFFLAL